jgi:LuxR family transcriptional regulator, maltose regulon positive regulatory protein
MAKPALAKLTRPRQSGVLVRERLFDRLDELRRFPVIWVSGPPGSGKTTAIASYLEQRKPPNAWYQVDVTDDDPATLFYYLREAAPKRGAPLPLLINEQHLALAEFSRRFFRLYFDRCPPRFVLVLDGVLIPDQDSALGQILHEAAQEVQEGQNLIVVSREGPPAAFARLELRQLIGRLGWEDLKLVPEETRAIATQVSTLDEQALDLLHARCGGWMAGLRLVLEHYQRTGQWTKEHTAPGHDALFGFFATEFFGRLPAPTQDVLLRTSMLPDISASAARTLTRNLDALPALADLSNRHLFVERLAMKDTVFRYHPLFREFLLAQVQTAFSAFDRKALQHETAMLLASEGRAEHAIPLLTQAGEWVGASKLILEEASRMLARGHAHTLRNWVRSLPSWYVDATPRLLYCLGVAQSPAEPDAAMEALDRAYARFLAQRNALGQALCAAGIIQAYYFRFDSYHGIEEWSDILLALHEDVLSFPSVETELHVYSMLLIALTYRHPGHEQLPRIAERVLGLISGDVDVNQLVVSAGLLLTYFDWFAPEKATLLVAQVQPCLRSRELTLFNRIWWWLAEAHHCIFGTDSRRLHELTVEIENAVHQGGMRLSAPRLSILKLADRAANRDTLRATEDFMQAMSAIHPSRRQEELNLRANAVELSLQQHDTRAAVDHARRALQLSRETGLVQSEMEMLGLLAAALCEAGHAAEAKEAVRAARSIVKDVKSHKLDFHHLLLEAYAELLENGQESARPLLQRGFSIAREHGYVRSYQWVPQIMARLCSEAISAGIELHYVTHIIRSRGLTPPSASASEHWPWPVKIHVLGQVQIFLDGQLLAFSGKAQKKPMELVKALVAKGPSGVDQAILAENLWPDSDADAGESALRMALHRLRKLVGNEKIVIVQEGRLKLNIELCWIDAWAFEEACTELESHGTASRPAATWSVQTADIARWYRGQAFGEEVLQPWMLAARDRWRARYLRVVGLIGDHHEAQSAWARAVEIYQCGVNADPLCEEFYQRLMICHLKQGKTSEAYSVYRRCRDILSVTLGVKPSPRTEALRETIATRGAA